MSSPYSLCADRRLFCLDLFGRPANGLPRSGYRKAQAMQIGSSPVSLGLGGSRSAAAISRFFAAFRRRK